MYVCVHVRVIVCVCVRVCVCVFGIRTFILLSSCAEVPIGLILGVSISIAAVILAVVLVLLVIFLIWCVRRCARKTKFSPNEVEMGRIKKPTKKE